MNPEPGGCGWTEFRGTSALAMPLYKPDPRGLTFRNPMKKIFHLIVFIVFGASCLFSCSKQKPVASVSAPARAAVNDDYTIYSAILGAHYGTVLVSDQTIAMQKDPPIEGLLPADFSARVTPAMLKALQSEYPKPEAIRNEFVAGTVIKLIGPEEKAGYFKLGQLSGLTKSYPKATGIVTFSRVVYSEDRNTAVVYVTKWCGSLCTDGTLYLFEKRDGQWTSTKDVNLWVA